MLGRLDEELSCANSRYFRTTLYTNAEVSALLRERFDAASADVARDVEDFVAMLRQYGILSQASSEEQGR